MAKATDKRDMTDNRQESFPLRGEGDSDDSAVQDGPNQDVFTQALSQVEEEFRRAIDGSRFDPRPDEAQVRQLRTGYARLMEEVRAERQDLLKPESTRLVDLLADANDLHSLVHTTADATLDSRFMAISADLGALKISKLALGNSQFGVSDLCTLLKDVLSKNISTEQLPNVLSSLTQENNQEVDLGRANWSLLGDFAMRHWRGVTTPDFLLGPIAILPKERRARTRAPRERRVIEPVVEALPLDGGRPQGREANGGNGTISEAADNVVLVYETLCRVAPVPLYKFITHPSSFSRTVECLFYVSFLISDNRVRLQVDPKHNDFLLDIMPMEEGDGSINDGNGHNPLDENISPSRHQAILSMTMPFWRQLVRKYSIKQPMIPT